MLLVLWILLIVLLLIGIAFLIYFIYNTLWIAFFHGVPFVPARTKIVGQIIEALAIFPGETVIDLGCGDARILIAAWQKEPRANYIGYESSFFPFWLARFKIWRAGANIKIFRQNFFKADLSATNRIFTYLLPDIMERLLPKLARELRPGARLISLDFPFSLKLPQQVIALDGRARLGKKLFVYQF